jgi:LmbE family N-acetylglucosaminyl deacetylase
MPLPQEGERIMVVVAHPDDEIIGAGGYLTYAIKNKAEVLVVILTNGEGNRLSALYVKNQPPQEIKNIFLKEGKIRQNESINALKIIGVEQSKVIFLDFPDRYLLKLFEKNWSKKLVYPYTRRDKPFYTNQYNQDKFYQGEDLFKSLDEIFKNFKPNVVITHNFNDYHPDHQATFLFVSSVLKNNPQLKPEVYTFLVHSNKLYKILNITSPSVFSPRKSAFSPRESVSDGKAGASYNLYLLPLDDSIITLKKSALSQYKSQLESPYLRYIFHSTLKRDEIFIKENE